MSQYVAILTALMEKAAVIAAAAFLLSLVRPFQRVVVAHWSPRRVAALVLVFGSISVWGSHLGIEVAGFHPNTRAIGVIVAGLVGGPWLGASVGLIGGGYFGLVVHGGTPLWPQVVLASVIDGTLAGLVRRWRSVDRLPTAPAFGFALAIQVAHLGAVGLTLLATDPGFLGDRSRYIALGPEVVGNALGVALFVLILRESLAFAAREVQLTRQEAATATARYQALQAQIQPHFLYNALNTISYFVRTRPDEARTLLRRLADYYRSALRRGDANVPLEEELDVILSYLDIERARFGDRLRVEIEASEGARAAEIPPLLLQPLVENAVKHGVSENPEGGTVTLRARIVDEDLVVDITDDGPGYNGEERGVGLTNVAERLERLTGDTDRLVIRGGPEMGTHVRLVYPAAR